VSSRAASRDEYLAEMKPFWDTMPADLKTKHKYTISVLSDSLASVVDDFTMTMGKVKVSGRSAATLVKVGGAWKWKTKAEAGWADMGAPPAVAPAPAAPAPGKAPPPPPARSAPPPPPAAK
jgi:hypothetical protein